MKQQRFVFTVTYCVDRDPIPGWGNNVEDWIALATEAVLRNNHYHPVTAVVVLPEQIWKDN